MKSVCLAVLLAPVNASAGAPLRARRHQLGELRAVSGYPPISAVGQSGKPREPGRREPTSRQHSHERWDCRASRAALACRRDQVPRGHPLSGRELWEQVVGLGPLQRDRVQARRAVPPQQGGQQPLAEAAVRVVEDSPLLRVFAQADQMASNARWSSGSSQQAAIRRSMTLYRPTVDQRWSTSRIVANPSVRAATRSPSPTRTSRRFI